MQYRNFTGGRDDLNARIEQQERRHFRLTLDRKTAEALKQDQEILRLDAELKEIEVMLETFYAESDSMPQNG